MHIRMHIRTSYLGSMKPFSNLSLLKYTLKELLIPSTLVLFFCTGGTYVDSLGGRDRRLLATARCLTYVLVMIEIYTYVRIYILNGSI